MNLIANATAQAASAAAEPGVIFVAVMGIAIVMVGLVCIILLCEVMSKVCKLLEKVETNSPAFADSANPASPAAAQTYAPIPNKGELIAAISAALAEEIGTDVSAIRIHSLRRVGASAPASDPARGELVAAISAALAEELGTDISAIRIHSLRKVG